MILRPGFWIQTQFEDTFTIFHVFFRSIFFLTSGSFFQIPKTSVKWTSIYRFFIYFYAYRPFLSDFEPHRLFPTLTHTQGSMTHEPWASPPFILFLMLQHNVVRKIIVPKLFMMLFIKYWPQTLMWTKTDQLNNSVTETFYLGQLQNRNWKVYKINKMIV